MFCGRKSPRSWFDGASVTDGETEATVRSALAATERERARNARIASNQPPVARR